MTKLATKILSMVEASNPIDELENKLKKDKLIKKVEVVTNKGVKDELHVTSKSGLHFPIKYSNGWFSLMGESLFRKHKVADSDLNMTNFNKIFNVDKVITLIHRIIEVDNQL
jgi:hypothetical protein